MTSSMLAGERRWAHARRGGMTVLGKIAAPKPLNLPSQKLENRGLDPNVDIVPKRSSSSASNVWGSSVLSPSADGATGSTSHFSGRPSSGGSGTRPSTAGSDRTSEPVTSAWGSNSRPSSASGALASNQAQVTSLRPRSAETRPNSSQRSRFAEPLSDNLVAWGPNGTLEKLGVASSKNDGFSLSTGDFPTLGSEKETSGNNNEPQDHGSHVRPSSSSGRAQPTNERTITSQADAKSGTVNTWKRDGTQNLEDGIQPSAEKWQGDPQQYLNTNVPPQHFEAWHGPPLNGPGGVWYRGPPGGPPYAPPLGPGGFPMEPFPFYRPQVPPTALGNSQPVPPRGAVPRGNHPQNGDLYRPQMPDAYMRPSMPIRPGFYPGPVAYEGYYGPPMGYCNSNERDIPFMGMAAGPSVYNRYPAQNAPEPKNTHARAGGHGFGSEHVESGLSDDTRGPYKVLKKQHNEWDAKVEEENWDPPAQVRALGPEKVPRMASRKNEWGAETGREEESYSRSDTPSENFSSRKIDNRRGVSAVDNSWGKRSEIPESPLPELPEILPASPKDSTLIKKIEGLNAKVRASDARNVVASAPSREEQKSRSQVVNAKVRNPMADPGGAAIYTPGNFIPASHEVDVTVPVSPEAGIFAGDTRRAYPAVQGRVDHRGKGRSNNQDAEGLQKKPFVTGSSAVNEPVYSVPVQDNQVSVEAAEKSQTNLLGKDVGESLTPNFDPSDCQAQRAKMRELAKQRAIQLQREEEERIREQKAKALAKLEELNRRTQAGDSSIQKLEQGSSGATQPEQEESQALAEPVMVATKHEAPSNLVPNPNVVPQTSESFTSGVEESPVLSSDAHLETAKNSQADIVVPHNQSVPLKLDGDNAGNYDCKAALQVIESGGSRHKRMSYKQKQHIQVEKNMNEESFPISTTEAAESNTGMPVSGNASIEVVPGETGSNRESSLPNNLNSMPEPSAHQRKRNNRSGKNKNKLDDVAASQSSAPKETISANASTESGKPKASQSELVLNSVHSVTDAKDAVQPLDQNWTSPGEEAYGRVNNQGRSQNSRRLPRNPQANRLPGGDTVVWAPVRSQNKVEAATEASQRSVSDSVATTTTKNDSTVQNSLKSKRAEMERYVPKPVAKELAQQGSIQQPMSSTSDETAGGRQSGFQSTESSQSESRNGDNKQNKQVKAHGAWRQRGPSESQRVQGLGQGSSSALNLSTDIQKPSDQHKSLKPVVTSAIDELEWDTSDGWNMPDSNSVAPVPSVGKEKGGVTGKGKRHPSKGNRSMGLNHDLDHKNISVETQKGYSQSAALEASQLDKIGTLKESRGIGERTSSHWQPKVPASSTNNTRDYRSSGGQNVDAQVSVGAKKESPSRGRVRLPPQQGKEGSEVIAQSHPDNFASENKNVVEASNVVHQEARGEKKVGSSKGRSHSPRQDLVNTDETAFQASMDVRSEHRISSGFRKSGSQNNRSGRGHDSRGDWSDVRQDNRQQNIHANRERQRHSSHYEYQPVGAYDNSTSNNLQGPADVSRNMGSRYRERGQGYSRRGGGNFNGRQSGSIPVDAGYD